MTSSRRVRGAWLASVLAVLAVFGGVVLSGSERCLDLCQAAAAPIDQPADSTPAVPASTPAALAVMPSPAADEVDPSSPVLVTATTGTITDVTMTNDGGKTIPGVLTPDRTTWKPTNQLGYGHTYTMTVLARGPSGMPSRQASSFTTVKVSADIYGAPLGDGLYGAEDEQVSFRIGDAHVSIADDVTKQVSVFDNGKLIRTMPTSMGMGGTEQVGDTTLSFWTPPGVYTVMDKANPVIMDSSTFGLPTNSRLGYRETIPWATRISTDGIYLHQLNATVWAQGNTDTSHGCLNLNGDNAEWFYDFAVPGDVVEIKNTGGKPLQLWQNGDWTVPWEQWRAGSKLT